MPTPTNKSVPTKLTLPENFMQLWEEEKLTSTQIKEILHCAKTGETILVDGGRFFLINIPGNIHISWLSAPITNVDIMLKMITEEGWQEPSIVVNARSSLFSHSEFRGLLPPVKEYYTNRGCEILNKLNKVKAHEDYQVSFSFQRGNDFSERRVNIFLFEVKEPMLNLDLVSVKLDEETSSRFCSIM